MSGKRIFDLACSTIGLLLLSPVFALVCVAVWIEDRHSPFYIGRRVGRGGSTFGMIKFRSMTPRADKSGVASTKADDPRVTRVGRVIRKLKLDEVSQLTNVFRGDMSLVGPRPQVEQDVALYTVVERSLLNAVPGITDFSSIIFSDEGEILRGHDDPDLRYNQVIRPWKSRLGLHYLSVRTIWLDFWVIVATLVSALSRPHALAMVSRMLETTGADDELIRISHRRDTLVPHPPPGADDIVQTLGR